MSSLEGKVTNWDGAVEKQHEHANKDILDAITVAFTDANYVHTDNNYDAAAVAEVAKIANKANAADVYTKDEIDSRGYALQSQLHSHTNKNVLDGTTASFTTELKEKLDGIAVGANKYELPTEVVKDANYATRMAAVEAGVAGIDGKVAAGVTEAKADTTAQISALKSELLGPGATEALDTIHELATALEEHADEYDALLQVVGSKADADAVNDAVGDLKLVDTGIIDRLTVVEDTLGLGGEFIGTEYNKGSGMLQSAYFNTNLSYEETVQILSEVLPLEDGVNSAREYLLFSMAYDKVCVDITRSEDTGKVDYLIWSNTHLNVGNREDYWFSTYASDDYNIGWNKTAENPITYTLPTAIWKNEADDYVYGNLPVGTHNSELTKIFSSTPFQFQPSELAVYTKSEVDALVDTKANSADVYTKAEIDSREYVTESQLSGKADVAAVENLQSVDAELSDRLTAIEDNLGE
jgi:hypothetical protein